MISFTALKKFGTTNELFKQMFAVQPEDIAAQKDKDEQQRLTKLFNAAEWWRRLAWSRVEEGMLSQLHNHHLYTAVDVAWDTHPITKATLPLMLFAQGRVDTVKTAQQLQEVTGGSNYVKKTASGEVYIDLPRFVEIHCNLVKAMVTRKLTALTGTFSDLYPYYKFESRYTSWEGRLRADVMSQLSDIQADAFGARAHEVDATRDALLYAHAIDFVKESWNCEVQAFPKTVTDDETSEVETKVVKQGVDFVTPPPSRCFWDSAFPLAKLNSDTGPRWLGYWDIVRYSEIADNHNFFNRTAIASGESFWGPSGIYSKNLSYFDTNYTSLRAPGTGAINPASNDRSSFIGLGGSDLRDTPVVLCNYFERVIPSQVGLGNYPYPVWVRMVVAGDGQVIHCEILPSRPGAYLGFNESSRRMFNTSLAHAIMPYQDQMTNLLTQLMLLCQAELLKIVSINNDVITDEKHRQEIESRLKGENWSGRPIILNYSLSKLRDILGDKIGPDAIISIAETKVSGSIQAIVSSMIQIIQLCEKLEGVSPNEQAQPNPREVSATEVNTISNAVASALRFNGDSINDYRAAKKIIIYESTMACHQGRVKIPVLGRYQPSTVRRAGFEVDEQGNAKDGMTLLGTPQSLVHDYIFTSRDGENRMPNTQAAATLVQLLQQLFTMPAVMQAVGKEKLFEIINEVTRLTTSIDLGLQVGEGEDGSLGGSDIAELKNGVIELQSIIQQVIQKVTEQTQRIENQEGINAEQEQSLKLVGNIAGQLNALTQQVVKLERTVEPPVEIPYRDAPEEVRRQMETRAGFPVNKATYNGDKQQ